MKNIHTFSSNQLGNTEISNVKGGATYNIFCEIYIGRQEYEGEDIDQNILNELMKWDAGLNEAIQKYSS